MKAHISEEFIQITISKYYLWKQWRKLHEYVTERYKKFNYLWATDMSEYFAAFLKDAMILSPNNQKFSDARVKYE